MNAILRVLCFIVLRSPFPRYYQILSNDKYNNLWPWFINIGQQACVISLFIGINMQNLLKSCVTLMNLLDYLHMQYLISLTMINFAFSTKSVFSWLISQQWKCKIHHYSEDEILPVKKIQWNPNYPCCCTMS